MWTKAGPRTATIKATTAAIWMTTLRTATAAIVIAAIAIRVMRPTGI